jgi:aspartate kinase
MDTLIMKFGGASVAAPEQFAQCAKIIANAALHARIVVVVSAMGNTTDSLLELARKVHPQPPPREQDMLISVGERISISLLAMALALEGCEAISFTGSQSGILTTPEHSQARITLVKPHRLIKALDAGKIAIVAGFQGVSSEGEITTLGRGGSDTTAVALGVALQAVKVEFYKDVPGIFSEDPKKNCAAIHHSFLSYAEALVIAEKGAKVLHPRCIALAEKNALPLHVLSFVDPKEAQGTWIGSKGSRVKQAIVYEVYTPSS